MYEGETLLGGWAKVFRKDRGRPIYKRLKLQTFNTGRSHWAKDPAGMIVKCTEADALRTSFPTHLGGLYTQEELPPIDITPKSNGGPVAEIQFGEAVPEQPTRTRRKKTAEKAEPTEEKAEPEVKKAEPTEGKAEEPAMELEPTEPVTPLEALRRKLLSNEISESQFKRWLIVENHIEPDDRFEKMSDKQLLDMVSSFDSVVEDVRASIRQ